MERLFVKNIHQNIYKYDLSKPDVRCLVIESNVYTWYLYNWTFWVYILHIAQYKQICLTIEVQGRWNRRVEGPAHSYILTEIHLKSSILKYLKCSTYYSCVHISSNEVFSKILKKPSIVQKKWYLIWKPRLFHWKKNKTEFFFWKKTNKMAG